MFFKRNKPGAPFAGSGITTPKKPRATRQAADRVQVASAVQTGGKAAAGARQRGRLALPPAPEVPKKKG